MAAPIVRRGAKRSESLCFSAFPSVSTVSRLCSCLFYFCLLRIYPRLIHPGFPATRATVLRVHASSAEFDGWREICNAFRCLLGMIGSEATCCFKIPTTAVTAGLISQISLLHILMMSLYRHRVNDRRIYIYMYIIYIYIYNMFLIII